MFRGKSTALHYFEIKTSAIALAIKCSTHNRFHLPRP
jgi:hypothetical protein